MDYTKLCNALLDSNDKIRYVGVYNSFSGDVYEKMQNGTSRHFDKDQTKKSMTHDRTWRKQNWECQKEYRLHVVISAVKAKRSLGRYDTLPNTDDIYL